MIPLCQHRANPKACPNCWREEQAKPKQKPKDEKPAQPTMPAQMPNLPLGKPPTAQMPTQMPGTMNAPYTYKRHDPAAFSKTEEWKPEAKPQLIDRLPRRNDT
jgi:hypothetical protein